MEVSDVGSQLVAKGISIEVKTARENTLIFLLFFISYIPPKLLSFIEAINKVLRISFS